MTNLTSVQSEEMYENTSILSQEMCSKRGMYLSTKLGCEWLT